LVGSFVAQQGDCQQREIEVRVSSGTLTHAGGYPLARLGSGTELPERYATRAWCSQ
jgi:hypothetical protein